MGLVQTNLTDDEHTRFNEVKSFLHEQGLIEKDSVYAAVKWMIVESCNMVAKMLKEQPAKEPEKEPEVEETAILHGQEIPVIKAETYEPKPVTENPKPVTEEPKKPEKRVKQFVIGGIDFRPRG